MSVEVIKKLSEIGEKEYNIDSDIEEEDLATTPPSGRNEPHFNLEDIDNKFKSFYIRDPLILLVGSCATQGKGADIDLVMKDDDLPDILKEANRFRLLRQMSGEFNIDYDETSEYLHIHDESMGSYTDYFPLYRLKVERIPNEYIHKMTLDDEFDNEKFEILEKSKRRIIAGTISTDAIDAENEQITKEALEEIWKHFQKLPDNYRNLMYAHSSSQIGFLIPSFRNRKEAFLDNKIYLIAELRTDLPLADEIWKDILKGDIHSFSIKINIPKPLKKNVKEICDDERCWTQIRNGRFIEVSLTESPANEECSDLQVLSK